MSVDCPTLRERARTTCPGYHESVELAVRRVVKRLIAKHNGNDTSVDNDRLARDLADALSKYSSSSSTTDDSECAAESVHAIFLHELANKPTGMPDEFRDYVLTNWREEIWPSTLTKLKTTMNESASIAPFERANFEDAMNACDDLSDLRDDSLCGGCAVS